ncbi:hypothetical protein WR25_14096 [Diploscapter pachys]|uniref:Ground-like domain-containing protein n=1 Tax=Diploscapter pachys TaxID=2018661 RepID=A0A2A2K8E8_9BILA|nr:hypothetical protein WR25_14096 [Diploscapter pachys]
MQQNLGAQPQQGQQAQLFPQPQIQQQGSAFNSQQAQLPNTQTYSEQPPSYSQSPPSQQQGYVSTARPAQNYQDLSQNSNGQDGQNYQEANFAEPQPPSGAAQTYGTGQPVPPVSIPSPPVYQESPPVSIPPSPAYQESPPPIIPEPQLTDNSEGQVEVSSQLELPTPAPPPPYIAPQTLAPAPQPTTPYRETSPQYSESPPTTRKYIEEPPVYIQPKQCYENNQTFKCCNTELDDFIQNAIDDPKYQNRWRKCNLQKMANDLEDLAQERFGRSFEVIVGVSDFVQKSHYIQNFYCKRKSKSGRIVLMYATPVQYDSNEDPTPLPLATQKKLGVDDKHESWVED